MFANGFFFFFRAVAVPPLQDSADIDLLGASHLS